MCWGRGSVLFPTTLLVSLAGALEVGLTKKQINKRKTNKLSNMSITHVAHGSTQR